MSTIDKALDILETINNTDGEISLADLAEITGCNRPTAYRICATLLKRGYVQQRQKRGKYSLGYKFLQYCSRNNIVSRLKDAAAPFLQALCNETSESINLSILDGLRATNIAFVSSESLLQVVANIETTLPLHCTATGKILLAHLAEGKRETVLNSLDLTTGTAHAFRDIHLLKKEIERVRSEGVAFDNEEYTLGVRSIAAPVRDDMGNVFAALSLIGPSIRISEARLLDLAPVLKKYASGISRALGAAGEA